MHRLWMSATLVLVLVAHRSEHLVGGQTPAAVAGRAAYWRASDAFSTGSLLLDRMASSNYQLFGVRRDQPGGVEQHDLDTDIVMVVDGAATFVTGGTITDPRVLRANESSGSGIRDGESRQLRKGDVVIVPNGTPHWFQEVSPTIRYFAVKLRQTDAKTRAPSEVMYWKGSEAFEKNGLIFEGQGGRPGRVYTLRRSTPLGVELHQLDTDIVLVVEGNGVFLTGGTIVEPRSIRKDEATGASVRDGEPYRLEKGAALVIPSGVPHWLRDVDGTIDFFAVKVR